MKKISKSDYTMSLKCLNTVWHKFNDKSKLPSLEGKFMLERGVEFGELAQELYPDGILINSERSNYSNAPIETKNAMDQNKPIFEASFATDQFYCKVDILRPSGNGWDILEVKSSTKVKPEHYDDLAFQKMVLEQCGVKVNSCILVHANKEYNRLGDLDLVALFKEEDLSSDLSKATSELSENINTLISYVSSELPDKKYLYCTKLKSCDISSICLSDLPSNNVFYFNRMTRNTALKLIDEGYLSINDVPPSLLKSNKHHIQYTTSKNKSIYINPDGINDVLISKLEYPISYFDFETLATPIPQHDNTHPYEKYPFQYSIHIQNAEDEDLIHKEFIEESNNDPRENLIKQLLEDLPTTGSIVVYYQSFEKGVIKYLAERYPEYRDQLSKINQRIIDLYVIFRDFGYYNPSQKGSASLKYVYPAVVGKDYSHLIIQNGEEAFTQYYNKYYDNDESVSLKALLDYCALDTYSMYEIIEELRSTSFYENFS